MSSVIASHSRLRWISPLLALSLIGGFLAGQTVTADQVLAVDETAAPSSPRYTEIPELCIEEELEVTPSPSSSVDVSESPSPSATITSSPDAAPDSSSADPTPNAEVSETPSPEATPTESVTETVSPAAEPSSSLSLEERSASLEPTLEETTSPELATDEETAPTTPSPSPSASQSISPSEELNSPSPSATSSLEDELDASASPSPSPSELLDPCPIAVTGVGAIPGDQKAEITWTSDDENTQAFFVRVLNSELLVQVAGSARSAVVAGLRNGVSYSFEVIAVNDSGASSPSRPVTATPTNGLEGEVTGILVAFENPEQIIEGQELVPGEQRVMSVDLAVDGQVSDSIHTVELSEPVSLEEAQAISETLAQDAAVTWAEPDQFVSTASDVVADIDANDVEYATRQWNLWDTYGVGAGTGEFTNEFLEATGAGVNVAVIDTGIVSHPDLDDQLVPGYDFVSSPESLSGQRVPGAAEVPFDADYADPSRFGDVGWDSNPTDPGDWNQGTPVRDSSWHGTHVAGIIAARTGNEEGVAGLAPKAHIQPVRALSWRGGLMSDVAASITWASGGQVDGAPINAEPSRVINMSFAMNGMCSNTLQTAINEALTRGAILVAAAGNANDDVANYAPANCEGVISVAATGRDGKRAPYSNFGTGVDVSAPGGNASADGGVVSTSNSGLTDAADSAYVGREGTSVAAAHVAAVAARILSVQPDVTPVQVREAIIGRESVRAFAGDICDDDPTKTCGLGIVQIASLAGEAGVQMNLSVDDALIADGSTVATGSEVTVGTSALLTPGTAERVLQTSLDPSTTLSSGSAIAPEGWTVEYSANSGSTWSSTQPTASSVTDIRARATVSAGLIEGTSQIYSTQTTSAIPSSTFLANAGGDGFNAFFYEDQVYNIFHHNGSTYIMCHVKSTSERCAGFSSPYLFSGYQTSMRSTGWVDAETGRLYAYSVKDGNVWVVCLNVSSSTPSSCGVTQMTTQGDVPSWEALSEGVSGSRKLFAVESGSTPSLLCFDMATSSPCSGSPTTLIGTPKSGFEQSIYRPGYFGDRIFAITDTRLYCFLPNTLATCSGSWPVTVNQWMSGVKGMGIAPHVNSSQVVDGVCYFISNSSPYSCLDLTGAPSATWKSPFILGVPEHPHIAMGIHTLGRFYYGSGRYAIGCWDYSTNAACTGFGTNGYKAFSGSVGIVYGVTVDPENPACLWMNSDAGYIYNFDAYTGDNGCSSNPVITLQPSQFAPRYACSTSSGITEWTELRLVSLSGGGTASSIGLTVRNASGEVVTGWSNRAVTLGQPLDMTGLDVALSGSRPTFSFAFSSITGTISTADIALDYKGKGPELCITTVAATNSPPTNVTLTGTLSETFATTETFSTTRSFTIGTTTSAVTQTVPTAPRNVSGSGINTTATVTFEEPLSDGNSAITGYQISSDAGSTWTDATVVDNGDGTYSTRVSGLTAGQTYTFAVAAVNSIGRGASSSASIQIQRARTESLVNTPLNRGPVTLEPNTIQGLALTYSSYTTDVCTVSSNIVTLVSEGECTLRAQNAGDPSASPPIAAVDVTGSFIVTAPEPELPDAPTGLTVTKQSGQVTLNWTAPTFTGYTAITDYIVQYKSGSSWLIYGDGTSSTTSAVVAGLTNGTAYDFRVAAVNSVGTSSFTSAVSGTPATTPGAPTSLSASRSGTTASLTWVAPVSTGGSAITDYVIEYKLSSDSSWSAFSDGTSTTASASITGLASGASYDFRVATANAIGIGSFTSTANLSATAGNAEVALTWTQPSFTGGESLSHYVVQVREQGSSTWTDSGSTTTSRARTVTGLTNGTIYEFRVAAVTTTSTSSYTSVATETPRTTPDVITSVTTTPGNRQVLLSWTAPSNGGSAITDYVIQYKAPSGSWTMFTDGVSTSTSVSVTSLTNGTVFSFRVASVNGAGTSAYSTDVSATPRTTPGAPTALTRTLMDSSLSLSWSAPTSNGGATITDYLIEIRESNSSSWTTVNDGTSTNTSTLITGLTNGTSYEVRVSAINTAGTGAASTVVTGTPRTYPGVPLNLTMDITGTDITLDWDAPASDGGSAITDYRIEYRLIGANTWNTLTDTVSAARSHVESSLDVELDYEFRVFAINSVGEGSASATASEAVPPTSSAASGTSAGTVPVVSPVIAPPITSVEVPSVLEPGEGAVMIDGVLVDITITPMGGGTSGVPSTWAVKGPDFEVSFAPQPVNGSGTLAGPAQGLVAVPGSWVNVQGDGYLASTTVKAYLILKAPIVRSTSMRGLTPRNPQVIYLGEVEVRSNGTFDIKVTVPETVNTGDYVLQVNGLSPQAKTRSVNMGLTVVQATVVQQARIEMLRKAFFQPRSAKFTKNGRNKLRAMYSRIPEETKNVLVEVTGVSVSMGDLQANLALAARRAEKIVTYLQERDVAGEYRISVETSMKFGSADRLATESKRSNKPLTTVLITTS